MKKKRIDGLQATYAAMEESKREPIAIQAADDQPVASPPEPSLPVQAEHSNAPPRVRKPNRSNDRCLAPTPDLEGHRARLREAFGTESDEFVDVMMRKLVDALRPSPFDSLDEATLNAGLAIISSMQPQSELEALLAVQIVATGSSGLRFLRESHRQMTEEFIRIYGGYATRLLTLQADLIRAFDRHRRGNRQTVDVQHVYLYPGSQGVIGIVNQGKNGSEGEQQK